MAKPEIIKNIILEANKNSIFVDDFDEALIGEGRVIGGNTVAVYDASKCIEILVEQGMTDLEALQCIIDTVDMGEEEENKPIFINDYRNITDIDNIDLSNLFN